MNQTRIDALARSLTSVPSRREVLRGLAGAGLAFGLARSPLDAAAKERKPKRKKGLCQKDGSPCRKPGKTCKTQFCLRAPFTIEASWTQTADHDTYLFVPPEDEATGPAPYIQACISKPACAEKYPFACVNDDNEASTSELATINRLLAGKYEYWVELYDETPAGGVTVVLKDGTGRVVRRWASPANPTLDRVGWHVFDVDGRFGRVTSVDDSLAGAETTYLPYGAHDPATLRCPN